MVDLLIASKTFILRYLEESKEKKTDNSSLPAGAPMYYYCKGCTCLLDVLPEGHWGSPRRYCDPCKVLADHGLLGPLKKVAGGLRVKPNADQLDETCRKLLPE